jgi:hypothetical protein
MGVHVFFDSLENPQSIIEKTFLPCHRVARIFLLRKVKSLAHACYGRLRYFQQHTETAWNTFQDLILLLFHP